ncbi:hypothetical protein SUDANB58_05841 (plasmid) [Streptomyces sp. enrichment culture]
MRTAASATPEPPELTYGTFNGTESFDVPRPVAAEAIPSVT